MALPDSGTLSLDDIHVEAGGTTQTLASINDSDIRGLISAPANSQMGFDDFYGASSSASFVGSIETGGLYVSDLTFSNVGTIAAVGDLIVIAVSSDDYLENRPQNFSLTGMTGNLLDDPFTTNSYLPGAAVFWGIRNAGDSSTIGFNITSTFTGRGASAVLAVFRNASSLTNYIISTEITNEQYPAPDPPSLASGSPTKLIVATGHLDDDLVLMGAPPNYTLAGAASGQDQTRRSSVAIAYKITNISQVEDPSVFDIYPNKDSAASTTMRFG